MKSFKLKSKQLIMMIGTAGELPKAPVKQTVFLEDMSEKELATVVCICNLFEIGCYFSIANLINRVMFHQD